MTCQMREEYAFEFFFEDWRYAISHNISAYFYTFFSFAKKTKTKSLGKTVLKVWSHILGKKAVLVHEISLKKV